MNARALATEAAVLIVATLWAYAGVAVVVAQLGEGQAVSIGAVLAVVVLAHALGRALPRFDVGETAFRFAGAALSIMLLYLILRVEIAGNVYVWDLAWFFDLLSDGGNTVEGRSGDVATVLLLATAWVFGVARGSRQLTFEGFAGEVTLGLIVVLFAALFADAADAPGIVAWLPVPYLGVALLALAFVYFSNVGMERSRPFAGAWALWVCGSLLVLGAIAVPTALIDLEALAFFGEGLGLVGKGIGLLLLAVMLPPLIGFAWILEWLANSVLQIDAEPFTPEMPTVDDLVDEENEDEDPASWTKVVGYILRFGLVAIAVTLALLLLWFAFRRYGKRDEDEVDLREEVEAGGGGIGSMLSGTLDRLRGRFAGGPRGRDPIGRLYIAMLESAAVEGLPRPAAATPLEFAPQLDAHFHSTLPTSISTTFASARYSGRLAPEDDVERLNNEWQEMQRPDD